MFSVSDLEVIEVHTLYKPDIGIMVRVFANGSEDLGSIPGRIIPKTQKIVFDATMLNTQHFKVWIKGKVEQSRERSRTLPYTLVCSHPRLQSPTLLDIKHIHKRTRKLKYEAIWLQMKSDLSGLLILHGNIKQNYTKRKVWLEFLLLKMESYMACTKYLHWKSTLVRKC